MDQLKNLYQNWVREELNDPKVQAEREAFLKRQFTPKPIPATGPFWALPAFRLAMVGCLAIFVVFQVNILNHPNVSEMNPLNTSEQQLLTTVEQAPSAKEAVSEPSSTQIKKIGSQVGPTMAYQKDFSDVQITVVWVFPKGV